MSKVFKYSLKRPVIMSVFVFAACVAHAPAVYAAPLALGKHSVYLDSFYNSDYDAVGVELGNMTVFPVLDSTYTRTDNVYATETDTVSDTILTFRPSLRAESDFVRHSVDFEAFYEAGQYQDNSSENYDDYGAMIDAELDATGNISIPITLGYSNLHEDRIDPDARDSVEPLTYSESEGSIGLRHVGQRVIFNMGTGFRSFDYDDAASILGVIDARDRNYDVKSFYTSIGVSPEAIVAPFVYLENQKIKYDGSASNRDSSEREVGIGTIINLSSITSLALNIGRKDRDFDNDVFDDISEMTYGADVSWNPLQQLSLLLRADRDIQEAAFSGTSASINSSLRLLASYKFRDNITVQPSISTIKREYQGSDTGDVDSIGAGLNVVYKMNPNVWVTGSYNYRDQDAESGDITSLRSFDRSVYGLSLKVQF